MAEPVIDYQSWANGIHFDMRSASGTYYDELGRPTEWRHIDTNNGNAVMLGFEHEYDPYGKHTVITDGNSDGDVDFDATDTRTSLAASSLGNPYMFTGRRYMAEVALQLNRNRWYDCERGRWLSRDPIGYGDGVSLYGYVNSQILRASDPIGLQQLNLTEEQKQEAIKRAKERVDYYRTCSWWAGWLAYDLLTYWEEGSGLHYSLSDEQLNRVRSAKETKRAEKALRSEFSEWVQKQPNDFIKPGQSVAVRQETEAIASWTRPESEWDTSLEADMFYSFHNLYLSAYYTGTLLQEAGTCDIIFEGDISYKYRDHYNFTPRNWQITPDDNESTDFIFWVYHTFDTPEAYHLTGSRVEFDTRFKIGKVPQAPGGGHPGDGY